MEKLVEILINIIAGAASGDPASYATFFCLVVIVFLLMAGIVKITGLPKLIALAWALDKTDEEDDIYDPEEGE